jgi:phospholipid/cholesterol/gamma-HCH transport system substrate-binding protein
VLYVLYARGAFEPTQRLVLVADDIEGVGVGMDLTFAGFPIGRVRNIELGRDGSARILVDVPRKDAHWLRTSSVFTLVRSLVGGTTIRAFSGVPSDPPLPPNAERRVLAGDATAEIPRLMTQVRDLLTNLTALTAADAPLSQSFGNVQNLTDKMKGRHGALAALMGSEADARQVAQLLERSNALVARLDGVAAKADAQVFGPQGAVRDVQATLREAQAATRTLNQVLADTRGTLAKVDVLLLEAQAVAGNVKGATTDLNPLRAEVEGSLRKVDALVNELNRKWPFKRDTEVKLP